MKWKQTSSREDENLYPHNNLVLERKNHKNVSSSCRPKSLTISAKTKEGHKCVDKIKMALQLDWTVVVVATAKMEMKSTNETE